MQGLHALALLLAMGIALALAYRPLGDYVAWTFTSPRHWRLEHAIYRLTGVSADHEQSWQAYARAVLAFSAAGLITLYLLLRFQHLLPLSLGLGPVREDLAFNTAASFVGNTNWQAYSPEKTVGHLVQMAGLSVQNFVSTAVGLAVAIALVRGFCDRPGGTLGNFWVDLVRATVRILLPLSVLTAIVMMAGGVIQNLDGFTRMSTVAGSIQSIPGGPVASQEAIKMLGTNGGGFYNANSAHPFENPSGWTNLFQIFLLLVLPFSLPRAFGRMVGDHRLGYTIVATMTVLFVIVFASLTFVELAGHGTAPELAGGAMEGKEQRFGIVDSALFATATTGTSGGAADSMHGSYTALGGTVLIINMTLGEVSPGGVGSGLYTILVLAVIGVFLTGLLLGRAPIFLGKRIGVREIKLASLFILIMPTLALVGMAITLSIPSVHAQIVQESMGNPGAQGMSEVIYAFVSAAINNGSAFAGLSANSPWLNTTLGIIILLGRFIPIIVALALAGSFVTQNRTTSTPSRAVHLPLHQPQFVVLLIGVIVYVSVPTFIPLLLIGPLAVGLR